MITLTDAQAYFDTKLNTDAWDYATSSDRTKAIAEAYRLLGRLRYGHNIDITEDYDWVQEAACEIALSLLNGDKPYKAANIVRESFGQGTIQTTGAPEYYNTGIPCIEAWAIIKPYLRDNLTIDIRRA